MARGVWLTRPGLVDVRKLSKSAEVEAAMGDAPTVQAMDATHSVPDFGKTDLSCGVVGTGLPVEKVARWTVQALTAG